MVAVGLVHRLAVLEPLGDDERRVEDRYGQDEQREQERCDGGRLQEALDGERAQREAEQQRARVAHEDPGRIEVVAQEADARAEHDRGEDRRLGLPQ